MPKVKMRGDSFLLSLLRPFEAGCAMLVPLLCHSLAGALLAALLEMYALS